MLRDCDDDDEDPELLKILVARWAPTVTVYWRPLEDWCIKDGEFSLVKAEVGEHETPVLLQSAEVVLSLFQVERLVYLHLRAFIDDWGVRII